MAHGIRLFDAETWFPNDNANLALIVDCFCEPRVWIYLLAIRDD
jgi:hypothetical protein